MQYCTSCRSSVFDIQGKLFHIPAQKKLIALLGHFTGLSAEDVWICAAWRSVSITHVVNRPQKGGPCWDVAGIDFDGSAEAIGDILYRSKRIEPKGSIPFVNCPLFIVRLGAANTNQNH